MPTLSPQPTRFFHRTSTEAAASIIAHGFRDTAGHYGFVGLDEPLRGVWISDVPVNCNDGSKEGSDGGVLFEVTLAGAAVGDLSPYEVVDPNGDYREWCVPASMINEDGDPRVMSLDEQFTGE